MSALPVFDAWLAGNSRKAFGLGARIGREQAQPVTALLQEALRDADEQHLVVKALRRGA